VLRHLPKFDDSNLIFGYDTVGDAGVYQLRDDLAIIQTVDILTPIADDPYTFGEIAAANSLSDVYVMGGKPVTALNIINFPESMDLEIMEQIVIGGTNKIKEAGAVVLGGHTIKDPEVKYGLAVTAIIDPKDLVTNDRAVPGDHIILTKPLGTGVISTALKKGVATEKAVTRANNMMKELNASACKAMLQVGSHACTDVTGFGLLGHAYQLSEASGVSLMIHASRVPIFEEAIEYARLSMYPGGTKKNFSYVSPHTEFASDVATELQMLLTDAQTSGGLLIIVPSNKSERLLTLLKDEGVAHAALIGEVREKGEKSIYVVR